MRKVAKIVPFEISVGSHETTLLMFVPEHLAAKLSDGPAHKAAPMLRNVMTLPGFMFAPFEYLIGVQVWEIGALSDPHLTHGSSMMPSTSQEILSPSKVQSYLLPPFNPLNRPVPP